MWSAARVWCVSTRLNGVSEFTSQRDVANIDTVHQECFGFNIKPAVLGGERSGSLYRSAQAMPAKCRDAPDHIDRRPFIAFAVRATVLP
ncbi:hypothetical protein SAMN03159316_1284 [Pseudomonas sp. NFR02]|nr:hypothetical protein SAMN03159316_1284 [Pseudomonas sp. NFR02]